MGIFNKKKEEAKQETEVKADANVSEPKPREADKGEKQEEKKKELTSEEQSEKSAIVVQLKLYTDRNKLLVENIQNADSMDIREFVIWKALTNIGRAVLSSLTVTKFIDAFIKQKESKRIHIPGGRQ